MINVFGLNASIATRNEARIGAMMKGASVREGHVKRLPNIDRHESPDEKRKRLLATVNDEWRGARDLSKAAGLSESYALKLLKNECLAGTFESRRDQYHKGQKYFQFRRASDE